MRLLRRWLEVTWSDRLALVRMSLLLLVMRGILVVVPFRFVREFVGSSTAPRPARAPEGDSSLTRTAWAADVVGRRILGDRPCLTTALVVQWLATRRGFGTELCIGVRKDERNRLKAHAWVEYQGHAIVGGRYASRMYKPLKLELYPEV